MLDKWTDMNNEFRHEYAAMKRRMLDAKVEDLIILNFDNLMLLHRSNGSKLRQQMLIEIDLTLYHILKQFSHTVGIQKPKYPRTHKIFSLRNSEAIKSHKEHIKKTTIFVLKIWL